MQSLGLTKSVGLVQAKKHLTVTPLRKVRGLSVKTHFKVEREEFWISKGYKTIPKDVKEYCDYWVKWQGTDEHNYFGSDDPIHAGEDVGKHPLLYVHEEYPDVLSKEEVNQEFDEIKEKLKRKQ